MKSKNIIRTASLRTKKQTQISHSSFSRNLVNDIKSWIAAHQMLKTGVLVTKVTILKLSLQFIYIRNLHDTSIFIYVYVYIDMYTYRCTSVYIKTLKG